MYSNDNPSHPDNEDPLDEKSSNSPQSKNPNVNFVSSPEQTESKTKSPNKNSAEKSSPGSGQKKNKSSQDFNNSKSFSSPSKSRFDHSLLPVSNFDMSSYQADISRFQSQQKKDEMAEKKIMWDEWVNAKKCMKNEEIKEIMAHEVEMTTQKLELKKMMEDIEKNKKWVERKDKDEEFLALKEAKEKLIKKEKKKDADFMRIEREKNAYKQKILEENKERIRIDQEEKRKYFLESLAAAKRMKEEEQARLKKEIQFEQAQEMFGRRELIFQNSLGQKSCLEKVGMLLSN
ncbi:hypothetical protein SteCoe_33617 [Stentor coeruleus]|uniref:Trichohyalin-plectin-homology domain-containing protein n=1 Tax=Stentor coeruleus TaxID=5963 RepID=A0A1R2AWB2_9CILI|nr:hypothetical protein SteCoe_33617 [Stentor coeruleus]